MSSRKELNCHEKWQVYQKMIQERNACAVCAPIIVNDFMEDDSVYSFDYTCSACKRNHHYHKHIYSFKKPNGETCIDWVVR